MKKRILITGASGFTGKHACRRFHQRGMHVIAVSRQPISAELAADDVRSCDLTDQHAVERLVCDVQPDYVLHLAGMNDVRASWAQPMDCMAINITGTLHLLNALTFSGDSSQRVTGDERGILSARPDERQEAKNDRRSHRTTAVLIVGSSLRFELDEEPPRPSHPYALSKTIQALAARSWSHLFNIPIMVAEPTNLVGPGASGGLCGLIASHTARWEQGLADQPFRFSSLTEKRDYLDVRDAVAAYEKILLHGESGALYRFGSGKVRSIGEVLACFRDVIGEAFPYVDEQRPPRDPDPPVLPLESMTRIGWKPVIPFEQSVRDILDDARLRLASQHAKKGDF